MRARLLTLTIIVMLTAPGHSGRRLEASPHASPGSPAAVDMRVADNLWVPAQAKLQRIPYGPVGVTNGRNVYIDGSADTYFEIDADREALTTALTAYVEHRGWRPRSHQRLNPGLATSNAVGWEHQCRCMYNPTADGKPRPELYKWHAEWEDDRHDTLTYEFLAEGRSIHGGGSFVPAPQKR